MFKLRKYHGDRVQSLTYEKDNQAASVGIMDVGEYEFGAVDKETTTVTSGKIWVRVGDSDEWVPYEKGETFVVPAHRNFKMKVDEISTYLCFYG